MDEKKFTYERHKPEETILYKIIHENMKRFFDTASSEPDRKPLPDFVRREFETFLSCGILSEGFVRVKCADCKEEMIVGFSCKLRGFCPTCGARRMLERSFNLCDFVIPHVPVRQWVLSLPFQLRYWMAFDHELLVRIGHIIVNAITFYLRKKGRKLGVKDAESGIISFLQRAGSALNLNLHFHLISIDGLYSTDEMGDPIFHRIPSITDEEAAAVIERIAKKIIKHLRKIGKLPEDGEEIFISEENSVLSHIRGASITHRIALGERSGYKVRRIGGSFGYEGEKPRLSGYATASVNGFSLHAATSIKAHERDKLSALLRYVGRGSVSNERISLAENGDILYELKNSYDGASHILLSPLEFMEKLSSLVPPPKKHLVKYYGCLSSHSALRPLIVPNGASKDEKEETSSKKEEKVTEKKSNYISWQELLRRTFEIDLTICEKCGGRLRVIAAIMKKEIAEKILDHLGLLPTTAPPPSFKTTTYINELFPIFGDM